LHGVSLYAELLSRQDFSSQPLPLACGEKNCDASRFLTDKPAATTDTVTGGSGLVDAGVGGHHRLAICRAELT